MPILLSPVTKAYVDTLQALPRMKRMSVEPSQFQRSHMIQRKMSTSYVP